MRAARIVSPGEVSLQQAERPKVEPDGVLIQVKAASLCGTDGEILQASKTWSAENFPRTTGHEYTGVVTEVGRDVAGFELGDRVLGPYGISCGTCYYCIQGMREYCETVYPQSGGQGFHGTAMQKGVFGITSDGSHAEYMAVPRADATLLKLPDQLSFEEGVLFSCSLPTGFSAVERAQITAGDTVIVLGLGPVGLCSLLAAGVRGASRLVAVDPIPFRRDAAMKLGATDAVDPKELQEKIGGLTRGRGFDKSLVVTTNVEAVEPALAATRVGGRVTLVATLRQAQLNLRHVLSRGIDMVGLRARNNTLFYGRVLQLALTGRITPTHLRTLMTHEHTLDDIRTAFSIANSRTDNVIKVIVKP